MFDLIIIVKLLCCSQVILHAFLSTDVICCCCCFLIIFLKNYFRNTTRVSNSFGPDQARQHVGPGLGTNCLQRLSADDTCRQRWCEIQYGEKKKVIRACTQQSNRSIENRLNLPTSMTRHCTLSARSFCSQSFSC